MLILYFSFHFFFFYLFSPLIKKMGTVKKEKEREGKKTMIREPTTQIHNLMERETEAQRVMPSCSGWRGLHSTFPTEHSVLFGCISLPIRC